MAKRTASENEVRFAKESRNYRIKNCQECKGAPQVENFELQGVCGHHCGLCMEVIDWSKVGAPILIKKVIATAYNGNRQLEITELKKPGVNFTDLTL